MSALNRKIKRILAESGQSSRAAARIEELVREREAKAWDECKRGVFSAPSWWNSDEQVGGFDMGNDEDGCAVETGAYMYLRRVLAVNPYRKAVQ